MSENEQNDVNLGVLLAEFSKMRHTLGLYLEVIKNQGERITELESKLVGVVLPSPEQALLDRYTESSKHNRNLNEVPQRIALAAHLSRIKQVPNMRITECGLMSQSKLHGLSKWDSQHLVDYCTLNNVLDIYQNGLPDAELKALLPSGGYEKLKAYLARRPE